MKHRWICMLLLFALLLTGCGQQSAPLEFTVSSEAALEELRAAAELTDAEFDAWRKTWDPERFQGSPVTREQAAKALALLDAVGYPLPEEGSYESMSLSFRPLEDYISIVYRMDGIRYRFVITPCQKKTRQLWFPAVRCELDGRELRLYRGIRGNLVGYLYEEEYRIQVIVMDHADRKNVDFTPFTWQGKPN